MPNPRPIVLYQRKATCINIVVTESRTSIADLAVMDFFNFFNLISTLFRCVSCSEAAVGAAEVVLSCLTFQFFVREVAKDNHQSCICNVGMGEEEFAETQTATHRFQFKRVRGRSLLCCQDEVGRWYLKMSTIYRFSLITVKGILSQMSTQGRQVVNTWEILVNVVKERSLKYGTQLSANFDTLMCHRTRQHFNDIEGYEGCN